MNKRASMVLALGLAIGCSSTVTETPDASGGCALPAGGTCPPGVSCPAGDGCNTCACGPNGALACTRLACAPDAGATQDVPGPAVDAGADVAAVDAPPADAPTNPGAVMLWQAPGGFAGTGPAVQVRGDGTVWTWRATSELTPGGPTPMPDATLRLSPAAAADLFARWDRVTLSGLPHGPGASSDCYPSVVVQSCATCMPVRLRYAAPAQVAPEMDEVWAWFDANVPTTSPRSFCAF